MVLCIFVKQFWYCVLVCQQFCSKRMNHQRHGPPTTSGWSNKVEHHRWIVRVHMVGIVALEEVHMEPENHGL